MLGTDIVYASRKLFVPFDYFCLRSIKPLSQQASDTEHRVRPSTLKTTLDWELLNVFATAQH